MGRGPVELDKGERLGALVAQPAQPAQGALARTDHPEEPGSPEPAAPERFPPAAANVELPATRGPRRPARYGLSIQFEQRPDDPELARLVETTVWVNEAHPAYRRAVASRSEGYHIAVASAMALAPLAVEPSKEHAFVTAFLASWGATIERRKGRN